MSTYRELTPIAENTIYNAFDGKREHMVKPNMPNIAYPSQHIDNEIH